MLLVLQLDRTAGAVRNWSQSSHESQLVYRLQESEVLQQEMPVASMEIYSQAGVQGNEERT